MEGPSPSALRRRLRNQQQTAALLRELGQPTAVVDAEISQLARRVAPPGPQAAPAPAAEDGGAGLARGGALGDEAVRHQLHAAHRRRLEQLRL